MRPQDYLAIAILARLIQRLVLVIGVASITVVEVSLRQPLNGSLAADHLR